MSKVQATHHGWLTMFCFLSICMVDFSLLFLSQINYSGKGYISGKPHTFKASTTDASGRTIFTAEGKWDRTSFIWDGLSDLVLRV